MAQGRVARSLTIGLATMFLVGCGGSDQPAESTGKQKGGRSAGIAGSAGKTSAGGTAVTAGTGGTAGSGEIVLSAGAGGTSGVGVTSGTAGIPIRTAGAGGQSQGQSGSSGMSSGGAISAVGGVTSSGGGSTIGGGSGGSSTVGGGSGATSVIMGGGAAGMPIGAAGAAGAAVTCPSGMAQNGNGVCVACSLTCNQVGQTGAIFPLLTSDGRCMCASEPGHFNSGSSGIGTYPCDADGDGWVRDSAKAALESADLAVKANARCTLRRVDEIVLKNEKLQTFSLYPTVKGTDLTTDVALRNGTLPLYESVRNDEQLLLDGSTKVPPYGSGRSLRAGEVNSLTKACVTTIADHNDNGIADVEEWAAPPVTQITVGPQSAGRDEFRNVYARLSYFVELDRAWFETTIPSTDGVTVVGRYHIDERSRNANSDIALTNNPAAGNDSYWKICRRFRDSFFADGSDAATFDFASLSGPNQGPVWGGMLHHSQFKCIKIVSDTEFAALTAQQQRTQLYKQSVDNVGTLKWDPNACSVIGTLDPVGTDPINPRTPSLSCTYQTTTPAVNQVLWVASNYQSYSNPGEYTRGCINECVEDYQILVTDPSKCQKCKPSIYGKASITPADEGTSCLLNRKCDAAATCSQCVTNFGDCNKDLAKDGCEVDLRTATDHCGNCNTNCASPLPANTITATCVSSQCQIPASGCAAGTYNINGAYADGCECTRDAHSGTIAGATPIGPVGIDGSISVTGTIVPQDQEDWFSVTFAIGATCAFTPKIVLDAGSAPVKMQVQIGSSPTPFLCGSGEASGSTSDISTWEFTYSLPCADDGIDTPTPSNGIDPTPTSGTFIVDVPSTPIYIKVHAVGSSTTCLPYTLTISN